MWLTPWHAMFGIVFIAAFFTIVGLIAYQLYGPGIHFAVPDYLLPAGWATTSETVADPLAEYAGVRFECDGEKALKAEFLDGSVRLALSDGRQIRLPETISASGARYANTDGSFVFWNKGITAFIEEGGIQTYASCLQH